MKQSKNEKKKVAKRMGALKLCACKLCSYWWVGRKSKRELVADEYIAEIDVGLEDFYDIKLGED